VSKSATNKLIFPNPEKYLQPYLSAQVYFYISRGFLLKHNIAHMPENKEVDVPLRL
jgi:hypothetical protein